MLLQYDGIFYAFKEKPKPLNLKQGVDYNLGKRWLIKWEKQKKQKKQKKRKKQKN